MEIRKNINFQELIPILINAFTSVYGEHNRKLIEDRINKIILVPYIREIKEETGCDVKLNGICYIANRILENDLFVMIVFNAIIINEKISFNKEEILDAKWFDYDEIVNHMENELRGKYVRQAVINQNKKMIAPIEIIDILKE